MSSRTKQGVTFSSAIAAFSLESNRKRAGTSFKESRNVHKKTNTTTRVVVPIKNSNNNNMID